MVHAEALTGPADVVLDAAAPLEPFTQWATAAKSGGGAVWMQINHPGRQLQADMPGVVWGPSAVGVDLGKHNSRFGRPIAMTPEQIEATVARFAVTAARAEAAGFDGVEIHAAHGYLLSQFLSPWSTGAPTRGADRSKTGPGRCWTSSAPPSHRPSPSRWNSAPPPTTPPGPRNPPHPRHPPGLRPDHRTTPTATSTTPLPPLAAYDTRRCPAIPSTRFRRRRSARSVPGNTDPPRSERLHGHSAWPARRNNPAEAR